MPRFISSCTCSQLTPILLAISVRTAAERMKVICTAPPVEAAPNTYTVTDHANIVLFYHRIELCKKRQYSANN